MDRKDFERLLSQGKLPSVLLFDGEEEHLKQEALRALRRRYLPEGMEELNETLLDRPETDALIAASETLPFLADRRLVIVRDHPAAAGRAEADDRLIEYLPHVPETTLLLFFCTGKADARKKLCAAIRKMNGSVTFSPLKGAELTSFVTGAFRDLGKECDSRTAEFLTFTCGSDASLLLGEIAKIASYREEPKIHPDDVRALATPSAESTVFQMVDAVVSGQSGRAFRLMRNQLLSGSDSVFLLSMLLRQYRLLQHVKIMQYEKLGRKDIQSRLGVSEYAADQYIRQASACTNAQVKKGVSLCFEAEYSVKSGRLNAESTLEAVMLKLLTLRKKD